MFKKLLFGFIIGLVFTVKALAQGVDYYLPYPGILPDHPFYWLKMVRDRVGLFTTTSQTAKAEKLLLYADKRLGAAWALIDGNKPALGVTTLTKAEKYLERAIGMRDSFSDPDRLDKAVRKHLEVLAVVKDKTGSFSNLVEEMIGKLEMIRNQQPARAVPATVLVSFGTEAVEEKPVEALTAFEALEKISLDQDWELVTKDYDFGRMVESVNAMANSKTKAWIFYVNGEAGVKAADKVELKAGDKVEWRYEAVKP